MSDWAPAFDALHDIEERRERALEQERQRRLERARRLASNGHLNPIQQPILVAVRPLEHRYDPTPIANFIGAVKPGCLCGWNSRRIFYTDEVSKRWWRHHVNAKTRKRS